MKIEELKTALNRAAESFEKIRQMNPPDSQDLRKKSADNLVGEAQKLADAAADCAKGVKEEADAALADRNAALRATTNEDVRELANCAEEHYKEALDNAKKTKSAAKALKTVSDKIDDPTIVKQIEVIAVRAFSDARIVGLHVERANRAADGAKRIASTLTD